MSKLWAVALLACALGTNAHAYDAVREVAKQQACLKVIYNTDICHMQQAATEELAQDFRRNALWACAQDSSQTNEGKAACAEIRADILGRWGC